MQLQDKVIIITGGCQGLGRAMAEMFVSEGAKVVFSDINSYPGKLSGNAVFVKADTSRDRDVKKLISVAVKKFGGLDIMVNNAGVGLVGEIATMPDKIWDKVLAINLNGVFYGLRAAAAYMKSKKIKGSIINMASILGQVGFRGAGAYSAT